MLRTELVRKRKAKEELKVDNQTAAEEQREYSLWKDRMNSEVGTMKESDAHFSSIKIHLISRFAEQICPCGPLPRWSVETHEHAHTAGLKI